MTSAPEQTDATRSASPPIRVLFIAPSIDILGGQAIQAMHHLSQMRAAPSIDIQFQPLNPRLSGPLQVLQRIKFLRTIATGLLYYFQLLCRVWRFDMVHMFSAGQYSYTLWTIPALLISKMYRKTFILNYHDGRAEDHLKWKTAEPTLRMADVILSPSDYVVKVFGERGIAARRIYNTLDPTSFIYRRRRKLRPVFLTNRILEPLYNVDCVLRAFAIVQKNYPEASLTIAHDGISRPGLEQLARDLGLANTRFIGRVPHKKIPEVYDAADIYVTSPNFDCMPGSLLECFCSGLPVIATAVGGIPYILEHERTGLLVSRNDHEAMAACAIRLLEDPDLVEYLTANARAEIERYSADRIGREWVSLYKEMASPRTES